MHVAAGRDQLGGGCSDYAAGRPGESTAEGPAPGAHGVAKHRSVRVAAV